MGPRTPIGFLASLCIFSMLLTQCAIAEEPPNESELCSRAKAICTELVYEATIKLTDQEFEKVRQERLCLQSYPWPERERKDQTFYNYVEPARMLEIMNTVNQKAQRMLTDRVALKSASNPISSIQDQVLALLISNGININLIRSYGLLLYTKMLLKAGNYDEVIGMVGNSYLEKVKPKTLDDAEEATYFSEQTIINMLALFRFQAESKKGPHDFQSGYKVLIDFLQKRNALKSVMKMAGDPTEQLFINIDCQYSK
jgi:hypothetical protein